MNKVLTIVVPSYNTEVYIDECLPTILNAKLIDDIEILLIDDGSTDHTAEKAQIYQNKFPNSVRLISKENGGHGSVINLGIEEAKGKYFKVIDGDDWVNTDDLDRLIFELENTTVDLVVNPMCIYNVKTRKENFAAPTSDESLYGNINLFEYVCNKLSGLFIHTITYRTELLRENNIRVQEHCFYEDKEFDIYPLKFVKTILLFKFPVYVYRVGTQTQSISKENLLRNKEMHYCILSNLIDFLYHLDKVENNTKEFIKKSVLQMVISNYGLFYRFDYGDVARKMLKEFDKKLKNDFPKFYAESSTIKLRILRNTSWPIYTVVYLAYKWHRKERGF